MAPRNPGPTVRRPGKRFVEAPRSWATVDEPSTHGSTCCVSLVDPTRRRCPSSRRRRATAWSSVCPDRAVTAPSRCPGQVRGTDPAPEDLDSMSQLGGSPCLGPGHPRASSGEPVRTRSGVRWRPSRAPAPLDANLHEARNWPSSAPTPPEGGSQTGSPAIGERSSGTGPHRRSHHQVKDYFESTWFSQNFRVTPGNLCSSTVHAQGHAQSAVVGRRVDVHIRSRAVVRVDIVHGAAWRETRGRPGGGSCAAPGRRSPSDPAGSSIARSCAVTPGRRPQPVALRCAAVRLRRALGPNAIVTVRRRGWTAPAEAHRHRRNDRLRRRADGAGGGGNVDLARLFLDC